MPEIFWSKIPFSRKGILDLPRFFNQKKINMYSGIVHLHSGLRWIVLGLLIYAIFKAYQAWKSGEGFSAKDKKMNLYALMATHIQILIGFYLYVKSAKVSFAEGWIKNPLTRFFGMEHIMMMLIGAILITIGYSIGKRKEGAAGAKVTFWLFLIGLLVILSRIPWPWQVVYGGSWG